MSSATGGACRFETGVGFGAWEDEAIYAVIFARYAQESAGTSKSGYGARIRFEFATRRRGGLQAVKQKKKGALFGQHPRDGSIREGERKG